MPNPATCMTYVLGYLAVLTVMSGVTFIAYGLDKKRAGGLRRRIPERTLHVLGVLGGWPGALVAQRRFRHKTRKASFRLAFWFVVLLHVTLVMGLAYLIWG